MSDQFSRNRLPLIIGHRGASAIAPENTLTAFSRALSDGADGIEFDVRLARDDTAVVIHDAVLERTAFRVVVESFALESIAEIKRLNPLIRTAALFERTLSHPALSLHRIVAQAVRCGANELALHRTFPLQRAAQEAARHNLKTIVWTVDKPAWVSRAARCGIHALITNDPARLCAERARILDALNPTTSMSKADLL